MRIFVILIDFRCAPFLLGIFFWDIIIRIVVLKSLQKKIYVFIDTTQICTQFLVDADRKRERDRERGMEREKGRNGVIRYSHFVKCLPD